MDRQRYRQTDKIYRHHVYVGLAPITTFQVKINNHVLQILQFNLPEFPNPHLLHFRCQNFVHNCYIHLKLSNFNDTLILAVLASAPKTLNYASVDMKSMLNFKSIVHPSFPVVHSSGQMQE